MPEIIKIKEVSTKNELLKFVKLPWKIYRSNKCWVPPLISERKIFLNKDKNPFFKHSIVKLYLAYQGEEPLGRIAAVVNNRYMEFHCKKTGFFGLFEVLPDYVVAEKLFSTCIEWLNSMGMESIMGPMNLSTNDECGLLIEGFDTSPMVLMPYNPPYYEKYMENFGFKKCKDLYAYKRIVTEPPQIIMDVAGHVRKKENVRIRNIDMSNFWSELEKIKKVYNSAWEKNWGFVPMDDEEFMFMAKNFKKIADPEFIFIVEIDGKIAGFSIALPDYNQVLKKMDGRLLPFDIFKFLYLKKKIDAIRVITLGVLKEYRHLGLESVLYLETWKSAIRKGIKYSESSWILEDNYPMNKALEKMGAKIYKKYRLYEMPLNQY